MSRLRAWGMVAILLSIACQKENPGLLLKISIASPSMSLSAAQVAGMLGQVILDLKPNAGTSWPDKPAMPAGPKGITVQSSAVTGDTITLDQAGGFVFSSSFELLLQPGGTNNANVTVSARLFDSSGAQIGTDAMPQPAMLQPGVRTTVALQLKCTRPDCAPAKGIVDLSSPTVTVQQYTGAAKSDKMVALATGKLLPGSTGDLVAGVKDKTVTVGGKTLTGCGEVYVFKSQNLQDSTGAISSQNADLTIIGRDSEAIGTAAAIGDFDGDGHADLVVTGVSATRPYCNQPNMFTPPTFPTTCNTDPDCNCAGAKCSGAGGTCSITTTGAGVAYVIFGGADLSAFGGTSLPLTINLNALSDSSSSFWTAPAADMGCGDYCSPLKRTVRIYGAGSQENLGTAVTFANGSDLVLTALSGAPIGGAGKIGRAYYLQGKQQVSASGSYLPTLLVGDATVPANFIMAIITGPGGTSQIGRAVASGDLDGDQKDELVIGDNTDGAGSAFVLASTTVKAATTIAPGSIDLSQPSAYDWKLTTSKAGSFFGYSVAVGDLEGTGKADVIVGARLAQQVYVVPGAKLTAAAKGMLDVTAPSLSSLTFKTAATTMTSFGSSLAVGQLVSPGPLSLLIGAPDDPGLAGDRAHAGAVYAVLDIGGAITAARTSSSYDLAIYGAAANDGLGDHLLAGQLDTNQLQKLAICGAANASTAAAPNAGIIYAIDSLPQ